MTYNIPVKMGSQIPFLFVVKRKRIKAILLPINPVYICVRPIDVRNMLARLKLLTSINVIE